MYSHNSPAHSNNVERWSNFIIFMMFMFRLMILPELFLLMHEQFIHSLLCPLTNR